MIDFTASPYRTPNYKNDCDISKINSSLLTRDILIDRRVNVLTWQQRILKVSPFAFPNAPSHLIARRFFLSPSTLAFFPLSSYTLRVSAFSYTLSVSRLPPFTLFLRCPRTSSPTLCVTWAQPITTWAETMGTRDKPGASQFNPFERAELLELLRPLFNLLPVYLRRVDHRQVIPVNVSEWSIIRVCSYVVRINRLTSSRGRMRVPISRDLNS